MAINMEILFDKSEDRAADFDPPKQNICCPYVHPTGSGFADEKNTQEARFCL